MNKLKPILLVEDDPRDAELTIMALADHNLSNRVTHVNDGVEALEFLRYQGKFADREREIPAVILLDIKMPKMDGIEVLEIIRNDNTLKTLPIVMLSSSREDPDLQKCYALGVNAYVVKPVDFKEFIDSVKNIGIFWALINEIPSNK
ncbi:MULTISPECIES: response regulator [unclassified Lentimicrobium]|uniref:response regulator n=1 Tax=unclassified Lentimicrobium TaxID=2677434 RepID=UPI0015547720|nr:MULTISPECIES: response regulator [unclassified Lentimicrobium]NPD45177.1 response regulator [Lentimicrobium sp. S6]NPD84489.1 response regulator [Lentimicrobium sp. L6]